MRSPPEVYQYCKVGDSYFVDDGSDEGKVDDDVTEDEEGHGLPRNWVTKRLKYISASSFHLPLVQEFSMVTDYHLALECPSASSLGDLILLRPLTRVINLTLGLFDLSQSWRRSVSGFRAAVRG